MPLKAKVDGPVMEFDKLEVGETLPDMAVVYDEDMQGRFLAALQEENHWYYRESPWGGPVMCDACSISSAIRAAACLRDHGHL